MKYLLNILFLSFILLNSSSFGQTTKMSPDELNKKLDSLTTIQKGLANQVQLNVSNVEIADLLNSIALENNLNLSVDPNLKETVTYNFFNATVKDVFSFLFINYDLTIDFVGSIIVFKKFAPKTPTPKKAPIELPQVTYNKNNTFLSVDLENDTLKNVVYEITKQSSKNIVLDPSIKDQIVSGYFINRPIFETLEMIAKANNLTLKDENDIFYFSPLTAPTTGNTSNRSTGLSRNNNNQTQTPEENVNFEIIKKSPTSVSIKAKEIPIKEIIEKTAKELNEHYFIYALPETKVTISIENTTFEHLLMKLLNDTQYSYRLEDRVFIIGEQRAEGLRVTELIKLEYRTIENVVNTIPKDLTEGLEVHEFIELNGIVVSGSARRVDELRHFLHTIDQVVPMIQIDVIIMTSSKSNNLATGIKAALDANAQQTGGSLYPNYNMNYSSTSVNAIIDVINGFGNLNLGKVSSDFFLSLEALESNSVLDLESTPKISTLNGHEASISVGEQRYYQEEQVQVSNVVGNANVQSSRIWKQIEASLEVSIKPFVSSDEHVTLTISVGQNDFGEQIDPTAPPSSTTQQFQSVVRVKNGEVILMGGLERKSSRNQGSGIPFLSRIPILKWFLSSRTQSKEKSKLHILIRPTVTY